MASNSQIILRDILTQEKQKRCPERSDANFFELYLCEQVLKNHDLSYDELDSGIVGRGGDGGIDGLHPFANGTLLLEDTDPKGFGNNIQLDLYIIQAKTTASFDETTLDKFRATVDDLLDLSHDLSSYSTVYNADVLRNMNIFREAYRALASKFPTVSLHFVYGTQGDTAQVHPNVKRKVDVLRERCSDLFSGSGFDFKFLGAREILDAATRRPVQTYSLAFVGQPLPSVYPEGDETVGYVCLVRLKEYFKFVSDASGGRKMTLFESNVRDYQGRVEVNKGIAATLSLEAKEDFWWLNNGITIIVSKASIAGKTITVEDPQVVNGLQTSSEIADFFTKNQSRDDKRSILVRVIQTPDEESRDKIIKATNSQTYIPATSLRATETIHRHIEHYFQAQGYFYDRRKNYYKNKGMPRERIIGIGQLAQAVMAILLQRPNDSRARPSSLLNREDDYVRIFSDAHPIEMYLTCAKLLQAVEKFLRAAEGVDDTERTNLRFHFLMYLVLRRIGKAGVTPDDMKMLDATSITDNDLTTSFKAVAEVFRERVKTTRESPEKVAKSKDFVAGVLTVLARVPGGVPGTHN